MLPEFGKFSFKIMQLLLQCFILADWILFILADWILYILVNDKGMKMTHTASESKKNTHTHTGIKITFSCITALTL
jgi:hypothetical protein